MVWYSHLFKNFPEFVVVHTLKGFGIVNKAEVDVFPELSWIFDDHWMDLMNIRCIVNVGNSQHPLDHQKKRQFRKTSTFALLTMPKPLRVWITINYGKS